MQNKIVTRNIENIGSSIVKKVFGFALFWFAAGMIVMMLLSDVLWGTVIAITGIVLAYCLFCR